MAFYKIQLLVSSHLITLKRAERLIELAHKEPDCQDALLGSAIVLIAVALEQALTSSLRMAVISPQLEGDTDLLTKGLDLLNDSAWQRVKGSPQVIAQPEPFELTSRSDYVQYLRDLIGRRNSLLHIEEGPVEVEVEIEGPDPVGDDQLRLAFRKATDKAMQPDGLLASALRTAQVSDGWGTVTPAEARRSLAAVNLYLEAVLEGNERGVRLLTNPTR
jgi:hypothetical protein